MATGGKQQKRRPTKKPGPAASKVASAIPVGANTFLVFLEDGRVVQGAYKEGAIEWMPSKDVVPGTSGPRTRGSKFVAR